MLGVCGSVRVGPILIHQLLHQATHRLTRGLFEVEASSVEGLTPS